METCQNPEILAAIHGLIEKALVSQSRQTSAPGNKYTTTEMLSEYGFRSLNVGKAQSAEPDSSLATLRRAKTTSDLVNEILKNSRF